MGKLYFYYGCMGSAKTANALMASFNFRERNLKTLLIKPSLDTRSEYITSRIGLSAPCVQIGSNETFRQTIHSTGTILAELTWIIIDESQFLTLPQVDELSSLVDEYNINVMCFGLKTNFKGELFEGSKRLIELADKLREIKTSCHCGRKALFNARVQNGKVVYDGPEVLIGANECYVALCRNCWKKGLLK